MGSTLAGDVGEERTFGALVLDEVTALEGKLSKLSVTTADCPPDPLASANSASKAQVLADAEDNRLGWLVRDAHADDELADEYD